MARALINPVITVNGRRTPYIPNSVEFTLGTGETSVRMVTAGGSAVTPVPGKNAETFKGMIKFTLPNTSAALAFAEFCAGDNGDPKALQIEVADSEAQVSFAEMYLISNFGFAASQDGEIELEFEGSPGVLSSSAA